MSGANIAQPDPMLPFPGVADGPNPHSKRRAGSTPTQQTVTLPNHPAFDYLVLPVSEEQEGLFPVGEVSVIAGPSGGGKTTWMMQFMLSWSKGISFFGRPTRPKKFSFISYDRSSNAFRRTEHRMRIRLADLNIYRPTDKEKTKTVDVLLRELLQRPEFKDVKVFFIEGLDMVVDDAIKLSGGKTTTARYLDDLQRVAEEFGLHIIATVGAPKMKPNDKYSSVRERIKGDASWGRKVETIIYIEPAEENNQDDTLRSLWVIPRNGPQEKHSFQFEHGQLVEVADGPPKVSLDTRVYTWVISTLKPGQFFALKDVVDALQEPDSSIQKALQKVVDKKQVAKTDRGKYQRPENAPVPDSFYWRVTGFLVRHKDGSPFTRAEFIEGCGAKEKVADSMLVFNSKKSANGLPVCTIQDVEIEQIGEDTFQVVV